MFLYSADCCSGTKATFQVISGSPTLFAFAYEVARFRSCVTVGFVSNESVKSMQRTRDPPPATVM